MEEPGVRDMAALVSGEESWWRSQKKYFFSYSVVFLIILYALFGFEFFLLNSCALIVLVSLYML